MPAVLGPQPDQVAEDRDRLVGLALVRQGVGQLVGRLGADRSGGGVEADRLVAAGQLLQHRGQVVVDPDIAGMALLGLAQHRLGRRGVAGIVQADAQQVQADGAQFVELRRPGQGLQVRPAGPPCPVDPGRCGGRSARGRGRRAGGFAQSLGPGRVLPPLPRRIAAQSSSAAARASATDGGRALIFAPASAGGRVARSIPASRNASA